MSHYEKALKVVNSKEFKKDSSFGARYMLLGIARECDARKSKDGKIELTDDELESLMNKECYIHCLEIVKKLLKRVGEENITEQDAERFLAIFIDTAELSGFEEIIPKLEEAYNEFKNISKSNLNFIHLLKLIKDLPQDQRNIIVENLKENIKH